MRAARAICLLFFTLSAHFIYLVSLHEMRTYMMTSSATPPSDSQLLPPSPTPSFSSLFSMPAEQSQQPSISREMRSASKSQTSTGTRGSLRSRISSPDMVTRTDPNAAGLPTLLLGLLCTLSATPFAGDPLLWKRSKHELTSDGERRST